MIPVYNNMPGFFGVQVQKKVFTALFLVLLASSVRAQSLSFGSITDVKQLTINKGEQKAFKASFFNTGSDTIEVDLVARYMSDLRVEIDPPSLNLYAGKTTSPSASKDSGWFVLSDGRTYVETKPVYIYVKVPDEVSTNSYKVTLIATAKNKRKATATGIAQQLYQTREIVFEVYVPGEVSIKREPKYIIETTGSSRTIIGPYIPSSSEPRKSGTVYGTPSGSGQEASTGFSGGNAEGTSGGSYSTGGSDIKETVVSPETSAGGKKSGTYSTEGENMRYIPSSSEGNRPEVFGETQSLTGEISSVIGNALKSFKADELSGLGLIPLLFIIAFLAKKLSAREEGDSRWKK